LRRRAICFCSRVITWGPPICNLWFRATNRCLITKPLRGPL